MPQLVDAGSNALAGFWELNKIKREKPYRDLQVQLGQQNLAESQQQMEARRKAMEEGDQFRKVMGFSQEELGVIARTMDKMTPENQVKFWNAKVKPYNGFELTIDPRTQRKFMEIKGQLVEIPSEGEPKFYGEQTQNAGEYEVEQEKAWLKSNPGKTRFDYLKEKSAASRAPNESDAEVYANNMAQAHKQSTGQEATPDLKAQWMMDYKKSARDILQTGMSQFAGIQDGQGLIFNPTRGGGGFQTLPLPGKGTVMPKTAPQALMTQELSYKKAQPVIDSISELSARINTGQAVAAKISGQVEKAKAMANLNDDVAEYQSLVAGFTPLLARAVGHVGVLTEQDVQSVRKLFPDPADSKSLRDRKVNRLKQIFSQVQNITSDYIRPGAEQAPTQQNVIRSKSKSGKPIISRDGGKTWEYE